MVAKSHSRASAVRRFPGRSGIPCPKSQRVQPGAHDVPRMARVRHDRHFAFSHIGGSAVGRDRSADSRGRAPHPTGYFATNLGGSRDAGSRGPAPPKSNAGLPRERLLTLSIAILGKSRPGLSGGRGFQRVLNWSPNRSPDRLWPSFCFRLAGPVDAGGRGGLRANGPAPASVRKGIGRDNTRP